MSRAVSTLSSCSPHFRVPPSLHEQFTQIERLGVHKGTPTDPTLNQTKSAPTMIGCWLLQSEFQYHALIQVRCSHIFTKTAILKSVTRKSIWQNVQIMYLLFQFCPTFCHPISVTHHDRHSVLRHPQQARKFSLLIRRTIFNTHCSYMFRPHYIAIFRELHTSQKFSAYTASRHM